MKIFLNYCYHYSINYEEINKMIPNFQNLSFFDGEENNFNTTSSYIQFSFKITTVKYDKNSNKYFPAITS